MGIAGGWPISVEGVRQALALVGIDVTRQVELPIPADPGPEADLCGVVAFADGRERVEELRLTRTRHPALPIVALVADAAVGQDVLRAGASSAVPALATIPEIAHVIESCLAGCPLLPTELAVAMIELSVQPCPSAEESSLLRQLERGETVRSVARRSGYSERHVYRMLKRLYQRLGVATKDAAIELARQRGWLSRTKD